MAQRPISKVNVNTVTELFHVGEKLNGNNWTIWREQMKHAFKMTGLAPYVNGTLPAPNQVDQPVNFGNWEFNNDYARVLIIKNVDNSQLKHITKYTSASDMWFGQREVIGMSSETDGVVWESECS
jgi:hypothetical protein